MFIYTCIQDKNCHQQCYGYENLMSSWGWGSKFWNLQQVGDFSILGSKRSRVQGVILKFSTRHLQCPSGVQWKPLRRGAKRWVWWDGLTGGRMGRVGRSRKVSFKFLHTLWVYRLCICLLLYEIKIVTNILMGLKISCQVGGRGQKFQNYSR